MARERVLAHNSSGGLHARDPERAIGVLAAGQHGVVARRQLRELGFSAAEVEHRIRRGRLWILHRGVYAVGHSALPAMGRWMVAVLAAGPDAVLGYRSAAELWGIRGSGRAAIEVVTPSRTRGHAKVTVHRACLPSDERAVADGIPVTTPARTLFDLAAVLDRDRLERAVHEAEIRRLLSPVGLPALLERHPGRRGAKALRDLLADLNDHGPAPTRSELEDRFLAVLRAHGLPRPRVNHRIETRAGTHTVDAAWPVARLVAELDGRRFHADRRSFEEDRLRDRALAVAGWQVVRITWRQLRARPEVLTDDLARLLAAPRAV